MNEYKDAYAEAMNFFHCSREELSYIKANLPDSPEDLAKLSRIYGGGYILKEHAAELSAVFDRNAEEFSSRCNDPETGSRFLYGAFREELANHEYSYTGDPSDALQALGFTLEGLQDDPDKIEILKKAAADCIKDAD
jgi:hypothetical protein